MARLVWVHTPTPEAHNATGFVELDDALADKLVAADKAQELSDGALAFREIQPAPNAVEEPDYETRDMSAKPRGRKGK